MSNKDHQYTKIEISRKKLYDLLTNKPVEAVAKELGADCSDLKNKCIKENIPVRPLSDWDNISLGYFVDREPLLGDPHAVLTINKDPFKTLPIGRVATSVESSKKPADKKEKWEPLQEGFDVNYLLEKTRKLNESIECTAGLKYAEHESEDYSFPISYDPTLYEFLSLQPRPAAYSKIKAADIVSTNRAQNIILREGVDTLHDLLSLSYSEFIKLRNLGNKTKDQILCDIKSFIAELSGVQASEHVQKKMIELLMEFSQLNTEGQQIIIDTAKAFKSLEKYTAERNPEMDEQESTNETEE